MLLCTPRWQGRNWSVIWVQLYSPGHFATTCTVVFILIVFKDLLVNKIYLHHGNKEEIMNQMHNWFRQLLDHMGIKSVQDILCNYTVLGYKWEVEKKLIGSGVKWNYIFAGRIKLRVYHCWLACCVSLEIDVKQLERTFFFFYEDLITRHCMYFHPSWLHIIYLPYYLQLLTPPN